jgi:hypothetical protein
LFNKTNDIANMCMIQRLIDILLKMDESVITIQEIVKYALLIISIVGVIIGKQLFTDR